MPATVTCALAVCPPDLAVKVTVPFVTGMSVAPSILAIFGSLDWKAMLLVIWPANKLSVDRSMSICCRANGPVKVTLDGSKTMESLAKAADKPSANNRTMGNKRLITATRESVEFQNRRSGMADHSDPAVPLSGPVPGYDKSWLQSPMA